MLDLNLKTGVNTLKTCYVFYKVYILRGEGRSL